jgi:protein TonB
MSDRKPCLRCERAIDPYAKSCPYCNWDQSVAPPPHVETTAATPVVAPPPTADARIWRKRALLGGIFAVLVTVAFVVGALLHNDEPRGAEKSEKTETTAAAVDTRGPRDVSLVPVTGNIDDQPVTSAPAVTASNGAPNGPEQRNDATALPSTEYAAVAQRAMAERQQKGLVDPRTITGAAYDASGMPRPRRPAPPAMANGAPMATPPMASSANSAPLPPLVARVQQTPPIPEYQPVPRLHVDRSVTARLNLTVGADGRVKDVEISEAIPGATPQLIAAVQNWRFRPATENGRPVEGRFSVDISFHGND